jgi:hypothetical protein
MPDEGYKMQGAECWRVNFLVVGYLVLVADVKLAVMPPIVATVHTLPKICAHKSRHYGARQFRKSYRFTSVMRDFAHNVAPAKQDNHSD